MLRGLEFTTAGELGIWWRKHYFFGKLAVSDGTFFHVNHNSFEHRQFSVAMSNNQRIIIPINLSAWTYWSDSVQYTPKWRPTHLATSALAPNSYTANQRTAMLAEMSRTQDTRCRFPYCAPFQVHWRKPFSSLRNCCVFWRTVAGVAHWNACWQAKRWFVAWLISCYSRWFHFDALGMVITPLFPAYCQCWITPGWLGANQPPKNRDFIATMVPPRGKEKSSFVSGSTSLGYAGFGDQTEHATLMNARGCGPIVSLAFVGSF